MALAQESVLETMARRGRRYELLRLWGVLHRKPLAIYGIVVVGLLVLAALLAPVIAPYDPIDPSSSVLESPSLRHWFGTDNIGRDVLSRVIWGARVSLWVGILAVVVGGGGGILLGITSGYFGSWVDMLIQRLVDMLMAFPGLVLTIALVAVLGSTTTNVILAVAVSIVAGVSRVARSSTLSIKENQYVDAARAIGCGHGRILAFYVLPNLIAPLLVVCTLLLGGAILVESSLSFLGLGVQPPNPTWGSMLSRAGRQYMMDAPWIGFFPGLAISLVVLGFNFLGDGLRDILDPRLRGS